MTKLCEVVLPIRTRNPLNQSQGASRSGMYMRARERRSQRGLTQMVMASATASTKLLLQSCKLDILLTRIAPSNGLDSDALPASMKSIRDGIADALGYTNDRHPLLAWRYDQKRGKGYAVKVEIWGEAA